MTKNNNLLNMEEILEESKKYDTLETATIGKDFEVQFYPNFKQSKIDNLLEEMSNFFSNTDKDSQSFIELINSDEKYEVLIIYFFIAKEFTHLGEDMKDKETPAELFPYFEALIETGYLTELIEDIFLQEELQKVIRRVAEMGSLNIHMNQLGTYFYDSLKEHEDKIKRLQQLPKQDTQEKE